MAVTITGRAEPVRLVVLRLASPRSGAPEADDLVVVGLGPAPAG
ncbi:MAG: hypothetical protein U0Q07_17540 [Acidimicrobiales bacterium]